MSEVISASTPEPTPPKKSRGRPRKQLRVPPDTITLSPAQLKEMITAAIAERIIPAGPNTPPIDFEQMGRVVGEAVATGMAKNTRRKVPYGEYIRRPHSSMHTDPKYPNGPPLLRNCWVNGDKVHPATYSDQEINLLNKLTHSGRYLDRLVEVIVATNGYEEEVQVRWNAGSADQRSELLGKHGTFVVFLEKIVKQQVEEDAENEIMQEEKQARRRKVKSLLAERAAATLAEMEADL